MRPVDAACPEIAPVAPLSADVPDPASPDPVAEAKRSRAEQSRINGSRSHGPATAAGKAASSANAFKHGLTARMGLLPDENPVDFADFIERYVVALRPGDIVQDDLCRRAAELAWRLRRVPLIEASLFAPVSDEPPTAADAQITAIDLLSEIDHRGRDGTLMRLQRYETRIERSLHACLREVRALQAFASRQPGQSPDASAAISGSIGTTTAPADHDQDAQGSAASGSFGAAASGSIGTAAAPADHEQDAQPPAAAGSGSFGAAVSGSIGTAPAPTIAQPEAVRKPSSGFMQAARVAITDALGKQLDLARCGRPWSEIEAILPTLSPRVPMSIGAA